MEKYIQIGHTKKTHGAQGELKVEVEEDFLDDFAEADVVFINVQGKPVPFFIENLRVAGELLLKLENIDSPNEAKPLVAQPLFVRPGDLVHYKKSVATASVHSFRLFVGYRLIDAVVGDIGEIKSVEEFPQQELAVVEYNGNEVLIPMHRQMLEEIDEKSKTLRVNLPEGLLEL